MTSKPSFLDETIIKLEEQLDRIVEGQAASTEFVELEFAADSSVGDYPQAIMRTDHNYFEIDGHHYYDRFPKAIREPIELTLQDTANWTDVLSSTLFSRGYLLNRKASDVFDGFDLGNIKRYPAIVRDSKGEQQQFIFLFIANHIDASAIDFAYSEFYLADMLSRPLLAIDVESPDDLQMKRRQAHLGEIVGSKRFSKIKIKKLTFLADKVPKEPIFGLGTLESRMYVSAKLCQAILAAGLTGVEFKENKRLVIPASSPVLSNVSDDPRKP